MDTDGNWYRQLAALVLLSLSRAGVEFLTNPSSRKDAQQQLRQAFSEIDYEAVATALTGAIENLAESSKSSLNETIDSLRDSGVEAVSAAQEKAEKQLGQKKGGGKLRLLFGLVLGGVIAYFLLDEQRRDDLLDRLTGASGPIQPTVQNYTQQAQNVADQATNAAGDVASKPENATQQQA